MEHSKRQNQNLVSTAEQENKGNRPWSLYIKYGIYTSCDGIDAYTGEGGGGGITTIRNVVSTFIYYEFEWFPYRTLHVCKHELKNNELKEQPCTVKTKLCGKFFWSCVVSPAYSPRNLMVLLKTSIQDKEKPYWQK